MRVPPERAYRPAPNVAGTKISQRLPELNPAARKPIGPGAEITMLTAVITRAHSAGGVSSVSVAKNRGKKSPEHTPFSAIAPASVHTGTGSNSSQVEAAIPRIEAVAQRTRAESRPPMTEPAPYEASSQPATDAPPPRRASTGTVARSAVD